MYTFQLDLEGHDIKGPNLLLLSSPAAAASFLDGQISLTACSFTRPVRLSFQHQVCRFNILNADHPYDNQNISAHDVAADIDPSGVASGHLELSKSFSVDGCIGELIA